MLLALFLVGCKEATVSISVTDMKDGGVEVDGISINNAALKKYSVKPGDTLYHLKLEKGDHSLRVTTNDLRSVDTTFRVVSGECYIGIDMESGGVIF